MRRLVAFLGLFLAGCSNAPLAGTLDLVFPSRPSRLGLDPDLPETTDTPAPTGRLSVPATPPSSILPPGPATSPAPPPPLTPSDSLPLPVPDPPRTPPSRSPFPPNT